MREVSYAARGYPERAYAKWLALNFLWTSLEPVCRKRAQAEAFRTACERDAARVVIPLLRAIAAVFVTALRFYRGKRGSGQKAIDVSTFFQRRNLHKEFGKHWRGAGNKSRTAFNRAWTKFRKALDEEMAG
jgi:hypothetical protein